MKRSARRLPRWLPVLAFGAVLVGGTAALAAHVTQLDPATVPTGFLATHNSVGDIPVSALARASRPMGPMCSFNTFVWVRTRPQDGTRILARQS